MVALKAVYSSKDEIPQGYEDLYTEQNGQFELTGVEGVKTQGDVDRVQEALRKEREDHKATKQKLDKFGEMDPDKVQDQLKELEELQARTSNDGQSDEKIEEIVQKRLAREKAPIERERDRFKQQAEEAQQQVQERDQKIKQGKVEQALRKQAEEAGVHSTAVDDIVAIGSQQFDVDDQGNVITADGASTPGIGPDVWMKDMKEKRPHWWPQSQGGGAKGNQQGSTGSDNPWSTQGWNRTEQGRIIQEQGQEKAEQLARAAGSQVGAVEPPQQK